MSKKCTPLRGEARLEVKRLKYWRSRTTFRSWDVEKVHAVVARSTLRSQNVQNTSASEHFWKLRCWKSARRCGAKHVSESKVEKTEGVRSTFGRSDVVLRGSRRGLCTLSKVSKTWGFCSSFNYNHHYTTLHYEHYTTLSLHYTRLTTTTATTTLLYTTLDYTTLPYITLHSLITPPQMHCNYTTLITLYHNYISTTLQLHLQLHYTTLHPAVLGEVHCNHCIHSNKHNSNHLSVHQWIRSAIRDSQQPTYFWNFRHRLVRYCWDQSEDFPLPRLITRGYY